jgi:hypothetical protein
MKPSMSSTPSSRPEIHFCPRLLWKVSWLTHPCATLGTNRPPTRREMHNRSLIEAAAAAVVAAAPAVVFTTLALATLALYPTVRSESRGYDRDSRDNDENPDE